MLFTSSTVRTLVSGLVVQSPEHFVELAAAMMELYFISSQFHSYASRETVVRFAVLSSLAILVGLQESNLSGLVCKKWLGVATSTIATLTLAHDGAVVLGSTVRQSKQVTRVLYKSLVSNHARVRSLGAKIQSVVASMYYLFLLPLIGMFRSYYDTIETFIKSWFGPPRNAHLHEIPAVPTLLRPPSYGPSPVDRSLLAFADANADELGAWEADLGLCPHIPSVEHEEWYWVQNEKWRKKMWDDIWVPLDALDVVTLTCHLPVYLLPEAVCLDDASETPISWPVLHEATPKTWRVRFVEEIEAKLSSESAASRDATVDDSSSDTESPIIVETTNSVQTLNQDLTGKNDTNLAHSYIAIITNTNIDCITLSYTH
jgi:hypothetical protein